MGCTHAIPRICTERGALVTDDALVTSVVELDDLAVFAASLIASAEVDADRSVHRWRRGLPSSLASTDHPQPGASRPVCPYVEGRIVVDLVTGEHWPDGCRTLTCAICLPILARRRAFAITLAEPYRMVTLTGVAEAEAEDVYPTVRKRISLVRRNLKRKGIEPGEWCWTVEKNPKGTGYHVHALQRGKYISQNALQAACKSAKAGIPDIRAIKRTTKWVSRYGLKGFGADGYGLKTFRATDSATNALRINAGALEHHSRGFYDYRGSIMRVRDMERRALAEFNRQKNRVIVACVPDILDKVLAARDDLDRVNFLVSQSVCENRENMRYRLRRRAPTLMSDA